MSKEKDTKEIENKDINSDTEVKQAEDVNILDKDEFIAKLNNDLVEQKKKADEYFDHLKRNMAEFDNFKKRISKEKDTMYSTILSDVLYDILPILDNFEKALETKTTDESFKDGIDMIYSQLKDVLDKMGLEEIEALHQDFNPNLHEAVMHVEDKNFAEKQVVEVLRKGYRVGDKVSNNIITLFFRRYLYVKSYRNRLRYN